jgi:hypothetical protein
MHLIQHILRNTVYLVAFFLLCVPAIAQEKSQVESLQYLAREYAIEFQKSKAEAIARADSLGLPIRRELENGRVIELMRFVNGRPIYATTYNADGATLLKTDQVFSGVNGGPPLDGSGQTLGLWDAGLPLNNHQELNGRITNAPSQSLSTSTHATFVAGSMIASGVDTDAKGMAPGGEVTAYDWDFDQSEMATAAGNGLLLSVNPYGYAAGWEFDSTDWRWWGDASLTEDYAFGFYDDTYAEEWDKIAYNAPNYLIVTPSGNQRGQIAPNDVLTDESYLVSDGSNFVTCSSYPGCNGNYEQDGGTNGYDSISYNALAKNVLTVGGVQSNANRDMYNASGWGPTDDGRIKPDIVAKAVNVYSSTAGGASSYATLTGTSYAAPMIGGSIGLLMEHQQNLHPGRTLLSSTWKALVIHTAEDLGATGPDYQFGWGLMNTQKAAQVISENASNGEIYIREAILSENQTIQFPIQASGSEPLKVTIAWTDPAGTPVSSTTPNPTDLMLVNDLDLRLEDSGSTIYFPYTLDPSNPANSALQNSDNFRDNVESVYISNPAAGESFTVTVSHKGSALSGFQQNFSIIVTGNQPVSYDQQIAEGSGEGWRFVASPGVASYGELLAAIWTQGATGSDAPSVSSSLSNVLNYDGSVDSYLPVTDLGTNAAAGSGFAVYVYADDNNDGSADTWPKTLSISGLENIGDIVVDDLLYSDSNVFTLLGNPFNSTIDFDDFTNQNQIGGVVYVYDHACSISDPLNEPGNGSGGCFLAWSTAGSGSGSLTDGLIAPFQGFFVYATGNSPELTIPESAKSSGGTFYKEADQQPVASASFSISLSLEDRLADATWLTFSETGSIEQNRFDAPYLYPLDYRELLTLFTGFGEDGYLIKNLPYHFTEPLQLPLIAEAWEPDGDSDNPGYIPAGGEAEFEWEDLVDLPSNWSVTLTDHQLGTVIDMRERSRYNFELSPTPGKLQSMPYEMALRTADTKEVEKSRFTVTIYPEQNELNSESELPVAVSLDQNYPNPFNPSTVIRYSLPQSSEVRLEVFSVDGKRVSTLVNEQKGAGEYTAVFRSGTLPSGIYFYRLQAGQTSLVRKMAIIR